MHVQVAFYLRAPTADLAALFWQRACTDATHVAECALGLRATHTHRSRCWVHAAAEIDRLGIFDLGAVVWAAHPLATNLATRSISDMLVELPEAAAPYVVTAYAANGHLTASVKTVIAVNRLTGALRETVRHMRLRTLDVRVSYSKGCTPELRAALVRLRKAAHSAGVQLHGLALVDAPLLSRSESNIQRVPTMDTLLRDFTSIRNLALRGSLPLRWNLPLHSIQWDWSHLEESLSVLPWLTSLDLSDNGLTYLDMREIGKWIERGNLDGLTHLDLGSNTWICTVGATTIATAAARLEHLACLVLRDCDVGEVDDTGDAGGEDVIMGGIFTHPDKGWRQEIVQLATNVLALAEAINALPSIVVFDLSGNKFSARERDMLKATLTPMAIEGTWVKEVRPSCRCCLLYFCPGPDSLAPREGMHVSLWPAKDCGLRKIVRILRKRRCSQSRDFVQVPDISAALAAFKAG